MKNKNNPLELLAENPNHSFNSGLEISDDRKTITRKRTGQKINIVSQTATRTEREELIRAVFPHINDRFKVKEDRFTIEHQVGDGTRSDVVDSGNGYCDSILEFKDYYTFGNKSIDEIFRQATGYAQGYKKDKYKNTEKTFISAIVVDLYLLIENPALIDLYKNSTDNNIKENYTESMKTFGIYIETRLYIHKDDAFLENKDGKTRTWCDIAVTEEFYSVKWKEGEDIFANFEDGSSIWSKRCLTTANMVTSSPTMSASNIRERLKVSNPEKAELVFQIAETLYKNSGVNGTVDHNIMKKASGVKRFVVEKDDSFSYTVTTTDDNEYKMTKKSMVTVNGALIDGQQSTECPHIIKRIIEAADVDLKNEEIKLRDKIFREIFDGSPSENDVFDFLGFIDDCHFDFTISSSNNINDLCVTNNKSIPQEKADIEFAMKSGEFKFLATKISMEGSFLATFPNCSQENTPSDNKIDIRRIPFIYEAFRLPAKYGTSGLKLFQKGKKMEYIIKSGASIKLVKRFIEDMVEKESVVVRDEKVKNRINQLENERKVLNGKKGAIESLNKALGGVDQSVDIIKIMEDNLFKIANFEEQMEDLSSAILKKSKKLTGEFAMKNERPIKDFVKYTKIYNEILSLVDDKDFKDCTGLTSSESAAFVILTIVGENIGQEFENSSYTVVVAKAKEAITLFKKMATNYKLDWTQAGNNLTEKDAKLESWVTNDGASSDTIFDILEGIKINQKSIVKQ